MPRREALTTTLRVNIAKQWLVLLAPFHLLIPSEVHLCDAAEQVWSTGAEFDRQLDATIGVRWGGNPLRPALANLARSQHVAIFVDRRVDPDQLLDFVVEDVSLRQLLQRLAAQLRLGIGQVGPVVYLGPPQTAAVLGTVAALKEDQDEQFPAALRTQLRRKQPLQWPELTAPRELVQRLAGDAGLQVQGLEQIPHDLWPEVDLPPLNFAQAMSLVLAGFGLTFDYVPEGPGVRLNPLPVEASITRRIPLPGSPAVARAEIRRRFPGLQFTIDGSHVVVDSTIEVADEIRRLLDGSSARPKPPAATAKVEKRYTLRVQDQPLGAVITAVAKEVGLELRFDPRVQDYRDKLVWLDVKDATLDQLLQILLKPAGLTYQIDQQTLDIRPAASP